MSSSVAASITVSVCLSVCDAINASAAAVAAVAAAAAVYITGRSSVCRCDLYVSRCAGAWCKRSARSTDSLTGGECERVYESQSCLFHTTSTIYDNVDVFSEC